MNISIELLHSLLGWGNINKNKLRRSSTNGKTTSDKEKNQEYIIFKWSKKYIEKWKIDNKENNRAKFKETKKQKGLQK